MIEQIKSFFTDNEVIRDCVKVSQLERLAGIPNGRLWGVLTGKPYRTLTQEQIKNLVPVLEKLGFNPSDKKLTQ